MPKRSEELKLFSPRTIGCGDVHTADCPGIRIHAGGSGFGYRTETISEVLFARDRLGGMIRTQHDPLLLQTLSHSAEQEPWLDRTLTSRID